MDHDKNQQNYDKIGNDETRFTKHIRWIVGEIQNRHRCIAIANNNTGLYSDNSGSPFQGPSTSTQSFQSHYEPDLCLNKATTLAGDTECTITSPLTKKRLDKFYTSPKHIKANKNSSNTLVFPKYVSDNKSEGDNKDVTLDNTKNSDSTDSFNNTVIMVNPNQNVLCSNYNETFTENEPIINNKKPPSMSTSLYKDDSFLIIEEEINKLCASAKVLKEKFNYSTDFIKYVLNYKSRYNYKKQMREATNVTCQQITSMSTFGSVAPQTNSVITTDSKQKIPIIDLTLSTESNGMSLDYDVLDKDDNILTKENKVEQICASPENSDSSDEINKTLELVEYLFNNKPESDNDIKLQMLQKNIEANLPETTESFNKTLLRSTTDQNTKTCGSNLANPVMEKSPEITSSEISLRPPEIRLLHHCAVQTDKNLFTIYIQQEESCTTSENLKLNELSNNNVKKCVPNFGDSNLKPMTPMVQTISSIPNKTPSTTPAKNKPTNKNKKYHYISSPVASYIYNTPQVPLVKDVHPKKPLPCSSCTLSVSKSTTSHHGVKSSNKENINLPFVVYKSAKKTRVIKVPDENKLPTCQWAKEMTLSDPTVMKHEYREFDPTKKQSVTQEGENYENISCVQAEISVCTQKTAFNTRNKE